MLPVPWHQQCHCDGHNDRRNAPRRARPSTSAHSPPVRFETCRRGAYEAPLSPFCQSPRSDADWLRIPRRAARADSAAAIRAGIRSAERNTTVASSVRARGGRRHGSYLDERHQSQSIRLHVEHRAGDAAARRCRGGRCRLPSRVAAAGAADRNHSLRFDGELCERAAAGQCHSSGCFRRRIELSARRNGRR